MNFYCILLLVILNICCFDCSPYRLNYVTKRDKYCGKRLTNMLFIVCKGKFYNPRNRRSASYSSLDNDYPIDISTDYDSDSVYSLLQKDFLTVIPNKRQIVKECCEKPCTVETMAQYCDY
ncbi:insulin-like [Diorhabda carinulata]|uniref:insulin-like n=1 Tax=Diorhabda sublineata TaxID=1163346 RepID=UPI0024E10D43|nr:insulin-like [Diorhabda sublineata]XP_057669328.1 insulin-like [Diorhabda carinulata]